MLFLFFFWFYCLQMCCLYPAQTKNNFNSFDKKAAVYNNAEASRYDLDFFVY